MTMRDSILAARLGGPLQNADGTTTLEFKFGAGDPVFAGHFPGWPILPGVFQLELTRVAAAEVLQCALDVREIRKAKFSRPVLPEETVRVQLKLLEKDGVIHASANCSVNGQPAGETFLILCRGE